MSFDRPAYLDLTIKSLLEQNVEIGEVHLFQDNAVNFFSGNRYATDEDIEASVDLFRSHFPSGKIHLNPKNVGIGLNFERAEQYIFRQREFQNAIFLEDDMVLGPSYIKTMSRLFSFADNAQSADLIGYIAAFGNHRASLEVQNAKKHKIVPMGHSWGFGLRKQHWEDVRKITAPYIELLQDCDYKDRPLKKISEIYFQLGLAAAAMSQDAVKQVATSYVGRVRVMPFICQAKYVGELGSNFTSAIFERMGYGKEEIFPNPPENFEWPSQDQLIEQLESDRNRFANLCADKCSAIAPSKPLQGYSPTIPAFKPATFLRVYSDVSRNPAILPNTDNGQLLADDFTKSMGIARLVEACLEGPPKVVLQAQRTKFEGWVSTEANWLSVLDRQAWKFFFAPHGVGAVLMEHVLNQFEHDEVEASLTNIFHHLVPGGHARIAVPDRNFQSRGYQDALTKHRSSWDVDSLSDVINSVGFEAHALEYWSSDGEFHAKPYSEDDGKILRSASNDQRNASGPLKYTSLIIDAKKPSL